MIVDYWCNSVDNQVVYTKYLKESKTEKYIALKYFLSETIHIQENGAEALIFENS